ncbi:MAG: Ldh family oxidoreductase, partial [Planktomarina sp.]
YKGWGFGLMAELLAAAITGSVNSLDVGGLKLPDGPPHGLGQFYFIIDPAVHHAGFAERLARIADAVEAQPGARLPGSNRNAMQQIEVPDALWAATQALATGSA